MPDTPSRIAQAITLPPRVFVRQTVPAISSPIAQLLRFFGSDVAGMVKEDLPYWEQYITPEQGQLKPQRLRPQSGTIPPGQPVWQTQLPDQFSAGFVQLPENTYIEPGQKLPRANITAEQLNALPIGGIISNVEPSYKSTRDTRTLRGLGRYTGSIGRDEEGLYWSPYDRWDMKSEGIPTWLRSMIEAMGPQDFTVYDRFRMTPRGSEASGFYNFLRQQQPTK